MRLLHKRLRHPALARNIYGSATARGAAGACGVASSSAAAAVGSTCGQRGPTRNPTNDNTSNNNDETAAACNPGGDSRDRDAPCSICYDTKQFVYGNRCLLCDNHTVPRPGALHPNPRNRLASPEGEWAGWKYLFRLCDNHRKKEWQPAVREALEWMDSGKVAIPPPISGEYGPTNLCMSFMRRTEAEPEKLRAQVEELEAQVHRERLLVGELRQQLSEQTEVPYIEWVAATMFYYTFTLFGFLVITNFMLAIVEDGLGAAKAKIDKSLPDFFCDICVNCRPLRLKGAHVLMWAQVLDAFEKHAAARAAQQQSPKTPRSASIAAENAPRHSGMQSFNRLSARHQDDVSLNTLRSRKVPPNKQWRGTLLECHSCLSNTDHKWNKDTTPLIDGPHATRQAGDHQQRRSAFVDNLVDSLLMHTKCQQGRLPEVTSLSSDNNFLKRNYVAPSWKQNYLQGARQEECASQSMKFGFIKNTIDTGYCNFHKVLAFILSMK
ncbi:hypothetical protein CYMTET_16019 [Cymbomonas tetramitiformis]|uniref:Uncharacterized protein n=1 Tax=Cymbomonas tetramitiformis TaxID=36881 RepID=A0AAE0L8P7_9CHLO|nr:hypothetical protein CYMTET_16019 [Cymbomonas tetramitiformis]